MTDYSAVSDKQLDDMYATNFDAHYTNDYTEIGVEILTRLQSVGSFVKGIFGFSRFPKFDARQTADGFRQVEAAQGSVIDNAKNVADNIGGFSFKVFGPIAAAGVVLLIIYFVVSGKIK